MPVLLIAVFGLLAGPAVAWTPRTQVAIGTRAASIAPPDLARLIRRHSAEYQRGLLEPFEDGDSSRHVKNEDGGGWLDAVILEESRQTVDAIRLHRPFSEVVYRLGRVAHYVADANNPLNTSQSDPRETTFFEDYLRYAESASERFAVVYYSEGREIRRPDELAPFVRRALDRGRQLYPTIGGEYRRIGGPRGRELFDDRSSAFATAALAYSHAVSDVAAVLRYVWLEAGGADPRRLPQGSGR